MVRLETELALERRLHGALDTSLAGEQGTTKLSVDEELAIEDLRCGVEGSARDSRVNVVLGSDGVGNQEPDDLELVEASSVEEAGQNLVDSVCMAREYGKHRRAASTYRTARERDHQEQPE